MMGKNKVYCMDCIEFLKMIPDDSVDMLLTSPPYWRKKDYGHNGQIGLELKFEDYLDRLAVVFAEVHRCLKPTGTIWVNIGDTYATHASSSKKSTQFGRPTKPADMVRHYKKPRQSVPEKCLCGIPHRFVNRMTDAGWVHRNTIIWIKRGRPDPTEDRLSQAHFEYIFLFVKSHQYFFNKIEGISTIWEIQYDRENTWHPAPFPLELAKRVIQLGCPEGGIVIDPFVGSGTTLIAARSLGRMFAGADINREFVQETNSRLDQKILSEWI